MMLKSKLIHMMHKVNPCDYEHAVVLKPIMKLFTALTYGTDCRCCLGARMVFALLIGFVIGFAL